MEVFSHGNIRNGKEGSGDGGDCCLGADYEQVCPFLAIAPISRVERVIRSMP